MTHRSTTTSNASLTPRAGPIVLKLGGAAIDDAPKHPGLWMAMAALAQRAPGGLIIVHGGGVVVDRRLAELGLTSPRHQGLRITPEDHLPHVVAALAGEVNTALVGQLRAVDAPAVGLTLGDGGLCLAEIDATHGIDMGRVGRVMHVEPKLLRTLLVAGFVPVICSIALDDAGLALNVNADDAAAALAAGMDAAMLVLLSDVPGVLDAQGRVVPTLDGDAVENMIRSGVISGGMTPKARAAIATARRLGAPVLVASWHTPAALANPDTITEIGTLFAESIPPRQAPAGAFAPERTAALNPRGKEPAR